MSSLQKKESPKTTAAPGATSTNAAPSRAAVQLAGLGFDAGTKALSPASMHEAAAKGTRGSGGGLPGGDAIQRSFGKHDVSQVQAHVGGAARDACASMSAQAYATGDQVAFKESPSLHTAAHEAAHVVQQRAGVSLSGGVGRAGDTYEAHADAVADAVVQGKSAEPILDGMAGGGGGATSGVQSKAVQLYADKSGPEGYDRVSDDGKLAVVDHGKVGWAETGLIARANDILRGQKSRAEIKEEGSSISIAPPSNPTGTKSTLTKFSMVKATTTDELSLSDDCGTANNEIMGSDQAGYKGFRAANTWGTTQEWTNKSGYHGDDNSRGGIVSTTEKLSGEIYVRIMQRELRKTLSREDALKEWDKLSAADKTRLSQKYGINEHAVPQMGQGITIGSERDMSGNTSGGYNFHFGFNLLASGHDYITLEDYAGSGVKYYLDMYGPASKNQAWAQDPGNTGALGPKTTTMVVVHPETLEGEANVATNLLDPRSHAKLGTLAKGDQVHIDSTGQRWLLVTIKTGALAGKQGWMHKNAYKDS